MNILTLLKYLLGNRQAILEVASNRASLVVGAIFVLAAGLARDYDSNDLLHEPWWLAVPFVVSTVLAVILFCLLRICMLRPEGSKSYWRSFPQFLGLFWMTAPLAMLYAVPYERFLDPYSATATKLLTLGIVSGWRVLLMMRVTRVLCNSRATAFPVLLMTDAAAILALILAPLPVLNIMGGGVRHTESEVLIQGIVFLLSLACSGTALIWIIVMPGLVIGRPLEWHMPEPAAVGDSRRLRNVAIGCVVVLLVALPFTQPSQLRQYNAEKMLRSGRIDEAITYLSSFRQRDLPPHWDPPPRVGYGERKPPVADVIEACHKLGAPDWIKQIYAQKAASNVRHPGEDEPASQEATTTTLPRAEQTP